MVSESAAVKYLAFKPLNVQLDDDSCGWDSVQDLLEGDCLHSLALPHGLHPEGPQLLQALHLSRPGVGGGVHMGVQGGVGRAA